MKLIIKKEVIESKTEFFRSNLTQKDIGRVLKIKFIDYAWDENDQCTYEDKEEFENAILININRDCGDEFLDVYFIESQRLDSISYADNIKFKQIVKVGKNIKDYDL